MTNILTNTRSKGLQLVLALVLGGAGFGASVMAQDAPAVPKVAVLDMGTALFNSDMAKKVEEELKAETAEDEQKVRTLAQEAQTLQEKLQKDAYQYLMEKLQTLMEERRQQFQETYSPNLVEAIKAIVEEENLDFVYRKEAVLYSKESYDITARVTERLNSQNR
jgi:outer membrane protein